jgi:hypothetical protein
MASTFVIHARRHWTFQLVLLGSRLRLEGWCDGPDGWGADGCCNTWLLPTDSPREAAEGLMRQPSCCL